LIKSADSDAKSYHKAKLYRSRLSNQHAKAYKQLLEKKQKLQSEMVTKIASVENLNREAVADAKASHADAVALRDNLFVVLKVLAHLERVPDVESDDASTSFLSNFPTSVTGVIIESKGYWIIRFEGDEFGGKPNFPRHLVSGHFDGNESIIHRLFFKMIRNRLNHIFERFKIDGDEFVIRTRCGHFYGNWQVCIALTIREKCA
jgi:hypothetical protein